jgi:signal peptidase II
MEKGNLFQRNWPNLLFGGIALFVVILDQLTKAWIKDHVDEGHSLFDAGVFRIVHIQNSGAAFGIFQGHSQALAFVALAGVIIILLLALFYHSRWPFLDNLIVRTGLGLVLGGTLGNLIDRITNQGFVTDFIDFKFWPVFNVADSATSIGVIIIAYRILCFANSQKN